MNKPSKPLGSRTAYLHAPSDAARVQDAGGSSLGHHLAFVARGSETLDPKAKAASAKITAAVQAGMKEFSSSHLATSGLFQRGCGTNLAKEALTP